MVPVVLMYSCSPFHHLFNSTSFTFFIKFQYSEVMGSSKEGKMIITDEEGEDDENSKKKRALTQLEKGTSSAGGSTNWFCQVENCTSDMNDAKTYHRRHKVCEFHAKAAEVLHAGIPKRFCQQCSRFHELSEFDEAKRSCRRRLAGHNERRRKITYDSQ